MGRGGGAVVTIIHPSSTPALRAVTQACLDQYLLELSDGSGTRWHLPDQTYGMKYVSVRLPEGLTCTQCVLQWKYNTGEAKLALKRSFILYFL
jgi:hypothetical protein